MRSRLFICVFFVLLGACTGKPVYVLSDKKMENVLFDLYIAETEINNNPAVFNNDSAKKQDLLQSVFQKHKISQAKFDTSLVWYNAHISRYMKINNQLTERYGHWINRLQVEIDRQAKKLLHLEPIQFKDLDLKDFVTPWLSPWLLENATDSVRPVPEVELDTLPGLIREEFPIIPAAKEEKDTTDFRLPHQKRAINSKSDITVSETNKPFRVNRKRLSVNSSH